MNAHRNYVVENREEVLLRAERLCCIIDREFQCIYCGIRLCAACNTVDGEVARELDISINYVGHSQRHCLYIEDEEHMWIKPAG